ncbi:MAG: serine/threonine protein kinase [Phycisphaeraceae bacterium]|nr:serine/threonine protein kinase [Phycisphaeraceae bacterium]
MPEPNHDSQIGRVLVERGLVTPQDIQAVREKQRKILAENPQADPRQASLTHLLIAEGYVTRRQIERLLTAKSDESGRHTLQTQQQIPGYQLLGKLGAGAMATVFKARQLSLDRVVAIKILPKKYTNNPEFIERFYGEGKAAAKLNHANIVAALDVGQVGDTHYFVMEYVEGRTLFDDITAGKKYDEREVLDIIIQVTRALNHAHKAGFIHRDVKPKNIMITDDGVVKLADMGLARAVSDREAAEAEQGKAFGTPYYIAPEQIRGELDVDYRADIYSLGATFYHLVTGKVPFDGPNPSAVMHKHLKAKLTPPDQINPNISSGICEIIEVCMAKDRDKRYASTDELLEDLESVARGEAPLQARRMFDLASLASLESSRDKKDPGETARLLLANRSMIQLLIWTAAAGWAFFLVAVVILAIKLG